MTAADRPVVVTGGAGFVGSALADALAAAGRRVLVIDTMVRPGAARNVAWLTANHGRTIRVVEADVRDRETIRRLVDEAAAVVHLAAQGSVAGGLDDPLHDFSVNAGGTLTVLEAVRASGRTIPLLHGSTAKLYGPLDDLVLDCESGRWQPSDPVLAWHGIDESRRLHPVTPHACSKAAADAYVLDHAATFGLATAVVRMGCIYGPRQQGGESDGWVAGFVRAALAGSPITLNGDGLQVRDLLHVADAVAAFQALLGAIEGPTTRSAVAGRAFNLGGGAVNAVSPALLLDAVARITGGRPRLAHGPWQPGDRRWFVADTRALAAAVGWSPTIGWREGVTDLAQWLRRLEPAPVISLAAAAAARRTAP